MNDCDDTAGYSHVNSDERFRIALGESRRNFGLAPRSFGALARRYLRLKPPSWMKETGDDRFLRLYEEQDLLLREGIVVWGQIVQANTLLFKRDLDDCPAAIVYSLDNTVDANPLILQTAAARLFSIKGDDTDEDLQLFSSRLADEHTADWKLKVPTRLTQGIECFYITTMVIRKHLPGRHLKGATFPFLVCPSKTDVGMILPGKYWSRECKRGIWRSRNRASS